MKRHKNWQEWGKRRAAQHQMARTINPLLNEICDSFFRRDPILNLFQSNRGQRTPFFSGSEMRIPLQFQESKEAPCQTVQA